MKHKSFVFIVWSALWLCLLCAFPIHAESLPVDDYPINILEEDVVKIENELQLKKAQIDPDTIPQIDKGYYIYTLSNPNILQTAGTGELRSGISKDCGIVIPTQTGYLRLNKSEEGTITYLGEAFSTVATTSTDIVDLSVVYSILNDGRFSGIADAVIIDSQMYHTSFLYFSANNEEYVVPFGSRPDWTGLCNGEIYTVSECVEVINQNWGKDHTGQNLNSFQNGGGALNSHTQLENGLSWYMFMIALGCGCSALIVFALKRRRKIKN